MTKEKPVIVLKGGMFMIRLSLKPDVDPSTSTLCLGYKEIKLLFNLGPFPGGGNCIFADADGEITYLNSNDVIEDLEFYRISRD